MWRFTSSFLRLEPKTHRFKPQKFKYNLNTDLCQTSQISSTSKKTSFLCTTKPTSIYVHLPFCKKRCHYCDFTVIALGTRSRSEPGKEMMLEYTRWLEREIKATYITCDPITTLYFGGGTPSLMPPSMTLCRFAESAEVTIEIDPGTFDYGHLLEYINAGVNRFSLGVQSFNDVALSICGRSHGLAEVHDSLRCLGRISNLNLNIDLISSLPNISRDTWLESLNCAIKESPQHISVYDLQIEQNTNFGRRYKPGKFPLPSDDDAAEMYIEASNLLKAAGYEHYEISNYAKPGFRSKHNLSYWNDRPYLGFGLGATSYINYRRYSRPKSMKRYTEFVLSLEMGKQYLEICDPHGEFYDPLIHLKDYIMLALRLSEGLDLQKLGIKFEAKFVSVVKTSLSKFVSSGLVRADPTETKFTLQDPEGYLLSNAVIADVFSDINVSERNIATSRVI